MNLDEGLEKLDEYLDKASTVPFSSKKMIDTEIMREMIDEVRLAMPTEIQKAKDMARDRQNILADARKQAEDIIKQAEERAKVLVSEQEILKQANEYAKAQALKANEEAEQIVAKAKAQDTAIRKALVDKLEKSLTDAQNVLTKNLSDVTATHEAISALAANQQ